MEFRPITIDEFEQAERLNNLAYWYKADPEAIKKAVEKAEEGTGADIRAAIDEKGKVCAKIEIHPYEVWFDGHKAGMGGIGGVATRPECRRGGYIRRLMTDGLEEMNDKGMTFSYLYPFSFVFYGKFGYDPLAGYLKLTAPTEPLLKCRMLREIEQYHLGDPTEPIKEVYAGFASGINMMVARKDKSWAWRFNNDPEATLLYYWLVRDENGKPTGYLRYRPGKDDEHMIIDELCWLDDASLETMMAFLGKFTENRDSIVMRCPPGFLPERFWPNLWQVKGEWQHCGMNRVINAERALSMMRKPWFAGSCSVEIHDETAPWNTGTYLVEWDGKDSTVTRKTGSGDIVLNANSMNALICGRLSPEEASTLSTVEVNGNEHMLSALFTKKPSFIIDSF